MNEQDCIRVLRICMQKEPNRKAELVSNFPLVDHKRNYLHTGK
jgi:hypothetical protein